MAITQITTKQINPIGSTAGQVLTSAGAASDLVWQNASAGVTNLAYTAAPTQGTVTSDTGTDAIIPLANTTNAGLFSPDDFDKLASYPAVYAAPDGSETVVTAGTNVTVTGTGTIADPYIVNSSGGGSSTTPEEQEFTTTAGANQVYNLTSTPIAKTLALFLNGVKMRVGAGNDYTISGTTITVLRTTTAGEWINATYQF